MFSLVMIQIKNYVGENSTLRQKGAKELFKIFVNSRHNIDKIPVDEDQEVPDPRDSSISKISTLLAPNNCKFSQDNRAKFLKKYDIFDFRAANRPLAALEEGADILEDIVDGLLHLGGDSVAVVPENNKEEALGEGQKVVR